MATWLFRAGAHGEYEQKFLQDLEAVVLDQIAKLISACFKGYDLARLVEAILKAQEDTTYRSPEGADGGADIFGGSGPLGFGTPRLCVEGKSESNRVGRPAVDKLLGAVSKFSAQGGFFVSWSGFRSTVFRDMVPSLLKGRLWTQKEMLEALFSTYDELDEDLRAELPLKRLWAVAAWDMNCRPIQSPFKVCIKS